MKHFVFWFPSADKRLQEIFAASEDKQALARTIKEIDRWLTKHPKEFGESRYENIRIAFHSPLGVLYEILDGPPTVIVLDIWATK